MEKNNNNEVNIIILIMLYNTTYDAIWPIFKAKFSILSL